MLEPVLPSLRRLVLREDFDDDDILRPAMGDARVQRSTHYEFMEDLFALGTVFANRCIDHEILEVWLDSFAYRIIVGKGVFGSEGRVMIEREREIESSERLGEDFDWIFEE